MGKRKAEQRYEVRPKVEVAELKSGSAEVPTTTGPTAQATGVTNPVSVQGVQNLDVAGGSLNVAPQRGTEPNRYQPHPSPVGADRSTGPTGREEVVNTAYVADEYSEVANQFWLLLERACFEVW